MALVYMFHKIHTGDMKVIGKMDYKMAKENKYLKTDLITMVILKMDYDMEKANLKIEMEHFMKVNFRMANCVERL